MIKSTVYDYENEAWIVDGKYQKCGHIDECQCYGTIHENEEPQDREAWLIQVIVQKVLAFDPEHVENVRELCSRMPIRDLEIWWKLLNK